MPFKRKNLLEIHKQRLRVLQEQQARLGIHTPPHIVMEIEEVEEQIRHLEQTSLPTQPNETERYPEPITTCPQCQAPLKLKPQNEDESSSFIIYSVRVGTSLECGHCGTIIPNQFKEEAKRADVKPRVNIGKGATWTGITLRKTDGETKSGGGVRPKNRAVALDRAFIKRVLEAIHENFTLEEMKELVMELDEKLEGSYQLYFDDLAGTNRKSKARELVQWCQRRQVLEMLVEVVVSLRPTVAL